MSPIGACWTIWGVGWAFGICIWDVRWVMGEKIPAIEWDNYLSNGSSPRSSKLGAISLMPVQRLIQPISLACLLVANSNRDLGLCLVLLVILNIIAGHLPCTTSTQRSTRSRRSCRFRMLPIMKTSRMIFRTSHMWDHPQGAREACILSSTKR